MSVVENVGDARHRRRLAIRVKDSLRDVRSQLALLNRQVGTHLDLKDIDFDCLDLINSHGPLSPSALAKQAGRHPATLIEIPVRLERAGQIVRERATGDRRAVTGPLPPRATRRGLRPAVGNERSRRQPVRRADLQRFAQQAVGHLAFPS
ncbi:MarR family transcriptional regulator [Nocardia sp. NBC_01730]|uniref:MarR family transcriptional regulator n=1 Tax=Nocardia sp. NBC_01730 TaxID=2975998 RepID=UPI002E14A278|nr:MarR family transcriptional regulator [Nocardia sp. NBC_01730]